ncbi:hypothetical protein OGAPHI_005824 [Ogataea philodendri]|uniref:Uncharacterized protein n=1 Tax=Ogataea philodendri TaxID=1378263 RepID=A0A9P8NZV7_9ASCO|nr:uncharacterized protein OGAPHI_005824 [Ogataea philodendri]KAH3662572.1 hypothetical protein OGAPHI_005824 [Ogataea philodendri]
MNSPVEVNRGVVMCSVRNIFASEPSDGKISRVSELTGFLEVVVENANLAKMVATNNFAVCKNQTVENVLVDRKTSPNSEQSQKTLPSKHQETNFDNRPSFSETSSFDAYCLVVLTISDERLRTPGEGYRYWTSSQTTSSAPMGSGRAKLGGELICGNLFDSSTSLEIEYGVDKNIPVGLIHVDDRTNLDATGGRGDLELLHHDEPAVPAKNHQLACLIQHNEPFLVESRRLYMANCHDPVGRGRKGVSGDAGVSTSGNVNFSITSSCLNGCRGAGLVTAGVNGAASAGLKVNFGFSAGFEDGSGWGAGVGLKRGAGAGAGVGLKRDTAGAGFAGGATGGFSTDLIVSTGFT